MCQKLLSDLYTAFQECEDGDGNKLERWSRSREGGVNGDVIDKSLDSCAGKQSSNLGSPLYIACVCNSVKSVQQLLSLGADPNYIHPNHGDSPLLHCASAGYLHCLELILADVRFDGHNAVTIDRKIFLGQGLPQYEEGGRTPLQLAASHAQLEATQFLLSSKEGQHWLHCLDSFGRNILQATLDELALSKNGTPKQSDLQAIVKLLCEYLNQDYIEVLASLLSREQAENELIERNRVLRARCLRAEKEKQTLRREKGLAAVTKWYRPRQQGWKKPSHQNHTLE